MNYGFIVVDLSQVTDENIELSGGIGLIKLDNRTPGEIAVEVERLISDNEKFKKDLLDQDMEWEARQEVEDMKEELEADYD